MLKKQKNILVGIDGSYNSNRAFNKAVKLAETIQANLYVVRVVEDYYLNEDDGILQMINYDENPDVITAKDDLNYKYMSTIYQIKDTFLRIGDPKKIISTYLVRGLKIDLLIIGAIGRGYTGEKSIGSSATFFREISTCEVLIVE